MPQRENNRKIRDIIQMVEQTRAEFVAQISLMFAAGGVAWLATGLNFIPLWLVTHYGTVALERAITWRLRDSDRRFDLLVVLVMHLLIAMTYAAMPVYLWFLGKDIYQFAAMVLLVGSTLNVFLVRSQLWYLAICFVGPNAVAVALIAGSVARNSESWAHGVAILCIGAALIAYFVVAVMQAHAGHRQHLQTREKLAQAQKMEALGNLAGGMAHDFNNILNVITGTIELVRSENDLAQVKGQLGHVEEAANRGAALIRQVLSFARKSHLEPDHVDPGRILDEVQAMTQRLISERVEFSFVCDRALPRIRVDAAALVTALLNLVLNARDAIQGPGWITLRCRLQMPTGNQVRPQVVYSVQDNGGGIPADIIDKVTDPFFTTKRKGEGTGLGLSMVAGFAAQSGGALRIKSEVGKGTLVEISLPVDDGVGAEAAPTPEVLLVKPVAHSILVVEDQRELLNLFLMFLKRAGHDVHGAGSGDEALTLLEGGLVPQIVISDVVMPGLVQGRELAQIVRKRLPKTRMVLMSGFDESEFGTGPHLADEVVHLEKPIRLADLLALIQRGA